MGFMTPEFPDVDFDTWPGLPRSTRRQIMARHWVEHGFGSPDAVYLFYIVKVALYVATAAAVISLTPGLGGLGRIADWWTQPIVYQKVVIFTLLFEILGLGCGSGPLTGRFWPVFGGFLYWLRPNTIRLPPWPDKVPFTRGDNRTTADVALYLVVLGSGVAALLSPAHGRPVTAAGDAGLVDAVMMSNSPLLRSRAFNWFKHKLYLDPVNDLRPSWVPKMMAHVGGTTAEFLVPLVLVFLADGHRWAWFLVAFMVLFHLNITSTIPMGVPLEWNVFFIFSLFYLFGHYAGVKAVHLSSPLLLIILLAALAVVPIAGNLFPKQISFLPAMRYYAGNWATSTWCLRNGAEDKIESCITKASALAPNQLARLYGPQTAELMIDKLMGWRSMHTHGRALGGLVPRALGADDADYKLRDGEIIAGPLLGWNFGEGHLHNEQLLAAVQRRCQFDDGDVRVIILESQPIQNQRQQYRIVDAKTGLIEQGYVDVASMLTRQPWPEPGDEYPVHVTTGRSAR